MIDYYKRKLNPTETLRKNIPFYINLFTEYYGIDNREHIEKVFNNMFLVGTCRPRSYDTKIFNLKNSLYINIYKWFLHSNKIPDSYDSVLKFFGKCTDGSVLDGTPIGYYHTYYTELMKTPEERKREFIIDSLEELQKIYPSITVDNFEEVVKSEDFLRLIDSFDGIYQIRIKRLIDVNGADDLLKDARLNTVKSFARYYPDLTISNIDNLTKKGKLFPFKDICKDYEELKILINEVDTYLEPYVNFYKQNIKFEKECSDK